MYHDMTVLIFLAIFAPIALYIAYQVDKREEAERNEEEIDDEQLEE